jgi:hypothetical protein
MPTNFDKDDTSLEVKVQELLEMYRYGQISVEELVCDAITVGLHMGRDIINDLKIESEVL